MSLFELLQEIVAVSDCKPSDLDADELRYALTHGYVNCIDGRLSVTASGAAELRCAHDALRGG